MNKHFVTLPDGSKATRSSQNRTYSHAVATRTPAAERVRRLRQSAAHQTQLAAEYRANKSRYRNEDLFARWGEAKVIEWAADNEANAAKLTAEADRIEAAGEDSKWGVAGWAGRPDLAAKLAATQAKHGYETVIIPAERA